MYAVVSRHSGDSGAMSKPHAKITKAVTHTHAKLHPNPNKMLLFSRTSMTKYGYAKYVYMCCKKQQLQLEL